MTIKHNEHTPNLNFIVDATRDEVATIPIGAEVVIIRDDDRASGPWHSAMRQSVLDAMPEDGPYDVSLIYTLDQTHPDFQAPPHAEHMTPRDVAYDVMRVHGMATDDDEREVSLTTAQLVGLLTEVAHNARIGMTLLPF